MNRFMVFIDPTFVCKVPRDFLGFVFSLDSFEIEVIKFVEVWVVLLVIRDSDLFLGIFEIPGEFSSEGVNFLILPLGINSIVNEGVIGIKMINRDTVFFIVCEGSSLWFFTHSLVVSWESGDDPTTFVPLIMDFIGWLQDGAVWGVVAYLSSNPTVLWGF